MIIPKSRDQVALPRNKMSHNKLRFSNNMPMKQLHRGVQRKLHTLLCPEID